MSLDKGLLSIGILIFLTSAIILHQTNKFDEIEQLNTFQAWTQKHNKVYKSEEQFFYRFNIFSANLKRIAQHSNPLYKIGLNKFSDLTFEEFSQYYLNNIQPLNDDQVKESTLLSTLNLATEIDWNKQGAVTRVKDQGKCGSCWSFSATGALEGLWQVNKKQLLEFSEQQLMDCSGSKGNKGCRGGWMDWAFDYVWDEKIMQEKDYPYKGFDGFCNYDTKKGVFSISGYKYVQHNNLDQLQAALNIQPISVSIAVDQGLVSYTSGVYDGTCADMVNHGVLAVGYGETSDGVKYWTVKNSWSSDWGENGFFRMIRQTGTGSGKCYIANQAVYPKL